MTMRSLIVDSLVENIQKINPELAANDIHELLDRMDDEAILRRHIEVVSKLAKDDALREEIASWNFNDGC